MAGTDQTPTFVQIRGSTVRLNLATAVTAGQSVTVSFDSDSATQNQLSNAAALKAANLVGLPVTNDRGATVPTISHVAFASRPSRIQGTSPTPNTYGAGARIQVRLIFSEAVIVDTSAGRPRLKIRMHEDFGEKWAEYESSGSGGRHLFFAYDVVSGNSSSDGATDNGIAVLVNSLELNRGTIRSSATGRAANLAHAALTHDGAHRVNGALDGKGPGFVSATVDGDDLTVTFDEDLDTDTSSLPAGSAFTLTATAPDGSVRSIGGDTVSVPSGTPSQVEVTLQQGVGPGDVAKLRYATALNPLQDGNGNPVGLLSEKPVTNNTQPVGVPTGVGAAAVSTAGGSLSVSWTAPSGGPTPTGYDLRYYAGASDPPAGREADWIEEAPGLPDPGTTTSQTITGLTAETAYRVQVRAKTSHLIGPWSASASGTTAAAADGNNAPRAMHQIARTGGNVCQVLSDPLNTNARRIPAPAGTQVSHSSLITRTTETTEWPTSCTLAPENNPSAPAFDDRDGPSLTLSIEPHPLPSNVRASTLFRLFQPGSDAGGTGGRVFFRGAAAFKATNVYANLTATDPHGASITARIAFFVGTVGDLTGTTKGQVPQLTQVLDQTIAAHAPFSLELPAATGGDIGPTSLPLPYFYRVTGLPTGLSFDAQTHTISGTPVETGRFTVTYTADDADPHGSAWLDPPTTDTTDVASQEFDIVVAVTPTIELVRVVSAPTHDANGDGRFDTYGEGDKIVIDVEFDRPVKYDIPDGTADAVRLRLHVGQEGSTASHTQRAANVTGVHNGGRTLRFAYEVVTGDNDPDGVQVQADAGGNVVILRGAATLTAATSSTAAVLTKSGFVTGDTVGTDGLPLTHVNGRLTAAGPRPAGASVNGASLTVTLDEALDTSVDTDTLPFHLAVQGAGDLGGGHRNAYQHPSSVTVSNLTVSGDTFGRLNLKLDVPARAGDKVTVSYKLKDHKGPLKDTSGNMAPAFTNLEVTNNTQVQWWSGGPLPLSASVSGTTLEILFDEGVTVTNQLPGSAFTVELADPDDDRRDISGTGTATVSGKKVTVTLSDAVRLDELPLLTYDAFNISPFAQNALRSASSTSAYVLPFERFRVETVRDVAAPELVGAAAVQTASTPNRVRVVLYYHEALDAGSVPATGDFSVTVAKNAAVNPLSVAVEGSAVILTVNGIAPATETVDVAYTKGTNPIRDPAGNEAAAFTGLEQSALGAKIAASAAGTPALEGDLEVAGARLTLGYDNPLDPGSLPGPERFAVYSLAREANVGVDAVAVAGKELVLRLEHPVFPCDGAAPLTLTYRRSTTGETNLRSLDGASATDLVAGPVTNARASWCGANGVVAVPADGEPQGFTRSLALKFDQPLNTAKALKASAFALMGASGAAAPAVSGAAYTADGFGVLLTLARALEGGETVTVSYTRAAGDAGLWDAGGSQIADFSGVTATGAEAAAPAVTALAVTSDAGDDRTYALGDVVRVGVTFGEAVDVDTSGGAPRLKIDMDPADWGDKWAAYESGSGTDSLTFVHTVVEPNQSTQGIAVLANTLELNGGTIRSAAGADAELSHDGLTHDPAHKVDWTLVPPPAPDTTAPALASASVDGKTLTLAFDEALAAADTSALSFAFFVDGILANGSVSPSRVVIDGAAVTLHLGATGAAPGQTVSVTYDAGLAGHALRDASGNTVAGFDNAEVDNRTSRPAPASTGVRVSSRPAGGDTYLFGETIRVTVSFSQAVAVTGTPRLTIDMDPADWGAKQAAYESGSGTSALVFAHTVVEPNLSTRGIAVLANTLDLNGGAITSAATRADAKLAHAGLGHDSSHKVDWRPALSVADAEAREGQDTAIAFAVTLSRPASGTVTVDYATSDGTAAAGEDYTATSGTLTFANGESSKTISVPLLDDAVDEGEETFTLTLSNPIRARIVDGTATGKIINSDHMPRAWTSRFGRTVAVHVVDAVQARLDGASESFLQFGGQRLGGPPPDEEALAQRLAPELSLWQEAEVAGPAGQTVTFRELLLGSAFHLASDPGPKPGGPRLSAWGRVAASRFDGTEGKLSLDGAVTTATLGVDGVWKRWLTGLLLAYSEGDGSFTHLTAPGGDVSSSLTSLHPYAAYALTDRVRLWGVLGYGSGAFRLLEDARVDPTERRSLHTDLTMTMGALGLRGDLLQPSHAGGFELALRSDVMWMAMDSAKADNLAPTTAEASRLRLVLEGSRPVALAGGGAFVPSLEVGLRHDGGDAETGTGVEVGGSLRYASAWGLSIEASLRALVAHQARDYTEWGAAGALRFDPGRQGRGLTASVTPAWGNAASGMSRLWGQSTATGLAPADPLAPAGRVDAELGYGLATLRGRGLLTPYARVALSEGADQAWHLGTRLDLAESLNLSLEATRRAPAGGAAAHELALRASLGF